MAGNLKLLAGLAERPEVRELTGKVRSGLGASLEKAAGAASDRLQQVRGEDRGPGGQSWAEAGGPVAGERPGQRSGQPSQAEAGPAPGEDHARARSQRPDADEADESYRDGGGSSSEPDASSRGRRERSRSGR